MTDSSGRVYFTGQEDLAWEGRVLSFLRRCWGFVENRGCVA